MNVQELSLLRPDDWHVHLRDGAVLCGVVPWTSWTFGRILVMPNLVTPVTTVVEAEAYRNRILHALPAGPLCEPLMTLYLTESTTREEIVRAAESGFIKAIKLFPAGATTNSDNGVRDIEKVMPALERMAEMGLTLSVHGEDVGASVDFFDRETVFIDKVLDPLRRRLPDLRIVLEHVTTRTGVEYVREADRNLAATITPHHMVLNRNAIFAGGIRPHYYCLPIAKREEDRLAILAAAVSGDPHFFFGSDSAPHLVAAKESGCGSGGIFNAPTALACLATLFEQEGKLENLETFVALNGSAFYNLPASSARVTLRRTDCPVAFPAEIPTEDGPVAVFDPGFPLHWQLVGQD